MDVDDDCSIVRTYGQRDVSQSQSPGLKWSVQLREWSVHWADQQSSTTCSLACLCYAKRCLMGVECTERELLDGAVSDAQKKRLRRRGLCLEDVAHLATLSGLEVVMLSHVQSDCDDEFARQCASVLSGLSCVLIVNFHYWDVVESRGRSHFACLNAMTDDGEWVKIVDTKWEGDDAWIRVDMLVRSMNSPDNTVDANRGYVVLRAKQ